MIKVHFCIVPRKGEPDPDPVVGHIGLIAYIPKEGDYVELESQGTEYKVLSVHHTFGNLMVTEVSQADLAVLATKSQAELARGPAVEYPIAEHEIHVMLRVVIDEEEAALNRIKARGLADEMNAKG